MMDPILALRQSIVLRLEKDQQPLNDPLGKVPIYDQVPSGLEGIYITFGDASAIDCSLNALERNYEVQFSLIVWSTPGGNISRKENNSYGNSKRALEVGSRLVDVLLNAPLKIFEHDLIFIRSVSEKLTRDISTGSARVEIWFHAMTEYRVSIVE